MAFKIYRSGRYLIAEDTDTGKFYEQHADKVLITKVTTDGTRFGISGMNGDTDGVLKRGINIADIQDESGDAYTANSFWTFATENTGNFKTALEVPGEDGEIIFNDGGALGANANFYWDTANGRLSIGQGNAPGARLDVRAQGALSSDIALRVRNSADTEDFLKITGNKRFEFPVLAHLIGNGGDNNFLSGFSLYGCKLSAPFNLGGTDVHGGQRLHFATTYETNGTRLIQIQNGTAPTAGLVNSFKMYSADITEGNAAPHFRTENGDVIKLYKQDSAGISTVGDIVTVLQNLGLLS
jgi:hypothetical protein